MNGVKVETIRDVSASNNCIEKGRSETRKTKKRNELKTVFDRIHFLLERLPIKRTPFSRYIIALYDFSLKSFIPFTFYSNPQ